MFFLFGAPGVGKGTQAELLVQKYNMIKFSMGDVLREEMNNGSALGKKVEVYLKQGVLAPDDMVFEIVEDFIQENRGSEVLFDGFPRNINQALDLEKVLAQHDLKIASAIELHLPEEEIVNRIMNRSYCSSCGVIYNDITNPPLKKWICDKCGGVLAKRKDDDVEVIKRRLKVYGEETRPLCEYYRNLGVYKQVEASGTKEEVLERISRIINGYIK
jgi:adenylate kinase